MSELSLFDAIGEGKNATQDYLDTLSRALLRHHQLVKAIRIHGRYVPESLPMPGLPVLVAIFSHTNIYTLHQLPSTQIGQLVLSIARFSGQATHDLDRGFFEEVWDMGDSSFTTDSAEQAVYWLPLPERWIALEGTQVALHDKDHPVFKLLNVTARNSGPVLDICDGVVSLALESDWDGEWAA
ncbi:hypothetical protein K3H30_14405 [Aeromonas veronii]|uniref:hypothetical protein n=1 Tax=Aeromonas veronii TaxID=654 RepID=UPI001F3531DE|nr:hypothetical protein [Aeromonas veronii]MCF5718891.1 hypothetical protein [Aeromonas veronii]